MTLSVGHITYANCAPFFVYLRQSGFAGSIVPGVPSQLNRLLSDGKIDVSPSSSFEYGRNWRDYLLLPGHSISSAGPVQSVLLFSPSPLDTLEGAEIALTGESATSVNLLYVLLKEYARLRDFTMKIPDDPVESLVAAGRPALLIGDRALKTALSAKDAFIYDLGDLWHKHTGFPFVFALWIVRRASAEAMRTEVADLLRSLGVSRGKAFSSLETLAAMSPEKVWMGEENLVDYWRCMSYDLGVDHLEGLKLYYRFCVRHGLLSEEPQIRFFSSEG